MIKQNKEIKFQSTDMGLPEVRNRNRNGMTAIILFALVAGMVGLSFAADPLYRIFCKVTGYAGTTRVAVAAPTSKIIDQMITVRFDANVNKSLPWRFKPVQMFQINQLLERQFLMLRRLRLENISIKSNVSVLLNSC
jgi:cytochrome c oxidase assembly protein Cox11